jgi:hypothetical protein
MPHNVTGCPVQNIAKKLPQVCPACEGMLSVKKLSCDQCETDVNGHFALPPLACLSAEEQQFVLEFMCCSGSLKEMAKIRRLSYPSVRNLLDEVIAKIQAIQNNTNK